MNTLLIPSLDSFKAEIELKAVVYEVVVDLVSKVDRHASLNTLCRMEQNFLAAQRLNSSLMDYINHLEKKSSDLSSKLQNIQHSASQVRDAFVAEVAHFLAQSKSNKKVRDRLSYLEARISKLGSAEEEEEVEEEQKTVPTDQQQSSSSLPLDEDAGQPTHTLSSLPIVASTSLTTEVVPVKQLSKAERLGRILCHLEDPVLLQVFSYLETIEVLNTAQVCRHFFQRVDALFGTESVVVKQWKEKELQDAAALTPAVSPAPPPQPTLSAPSAPAVPSSANPTGTNSGAGEGKGSFREILESLTKKLNAQEMKVVLDVAERLKRQTAANDALVIANEDLSARLESTESTRDFLVTKLKTAEQALKQLMVEGSTLKKQVAADQEIISYLDLHVQELEGQVLELTHRGHHLQAALDLQLGAHSHREETLRAELMEITDRYDKLEASSKTQKKLLVKEVKALRGQVETLSQERSIHLSRMQQMREALLG